MSNGYHRYSLLQRALDPTLEPDPVTPDRSVPLIEGEPPEPTLPAETVQQAEDRRKAEDEAVRCAVGPQVWAGVLATRDMLSWTDERLRGAVNQLPPIERFSVFLGWALETLLLADNGMITAQQREQMTLAILTRAAEVVLPDVPGIIDPVTVKREITDVMLGGKVDGAAIDRLRRVQMLLKLAGKPGMEGWAVVNVPPPPGRAVGREVKVSGAPTRYTDEQLIKVRADWEAAKVSGSTQEEFADNRGIPVNQLKSMLAVLRGREKKSVKGV